MDRKLCFMFRSLLSLSCILLLFACDKDPAPITANSLVGSYRGYEMSVVANGEILSVAELNGPDLVLQEDGQLIMDDDPATWSLQEDKLIIDWPTYSGEAVDTLTVNLSEDNVLRLRRTDVSSGGLYGLYSQQRGTRVHTTVLYLRVE